MKYMGFGKSHVSVFNREMIFLHLVATEKGKKERVLSVRILLEITYDKIMRTEYIFYLGNGIFDDNIRNKRPVVSITYYLSKF